MAKLRRSISASVGRHGANKVDDVDEIQEMLNMVPEPQGGPRKLLKVDGVVGPKTIAAIQKFQLFRFGWSGADGRVDPEQQTMRWLRSHEGEFGGTQFRIAKAELDPRVRGVSDAYFVIIGKGNATYSLGQFREPNPHLIKENLQFTTDLSQWRRFMTRQFRSVRSFETNSAREDIFPNPRDPATSQVFLKLRLPRENKLNDFVELAVVHRWFEATRQPATLATHRGNFFLVDSSDR
jgi:hypothetical protein